jgi:hypothetical protein
LARQQSFSYLKSGDLILAKRNWLAANIFKMAMEIFSPIEHSGMQKPSSKARGTFSGSLDPPETVNLCHLSLYSI